MSKNYTVYHLHSTASNLSGAGMDSVTNYKDYIKIAKECGMTSLGFSEHGNFFLYKKKKDEIEKNGMKYIHGIEAYVTENIEEQVRDNYHIILIAKNYNGFKELNTLQSNAFKRDGHYYYAPRILFDDILNTSDNIIITSACFTKGNKVLTKNGYKNIEDITNKDFVKNMYGEWEQVNYPTRINYIGKGKEIGICGEIQKIRCTNDHKFLTITIDSKIPTWKKAEELIVEPGNTKPILLFPVKTKYNNRKYIYREEWEGSYIVTKRRKKIVLPDKIKITPEFMRFIGMFTADGCISLGVNPGLSVTINISEFETYYNSFIKELENQLGVKFHIRKRPDGNRVDVVFCGNDFINLFYWLFKNQKAINKRFPKQLLHISKEMDEELLFGYIISDGYVKESISKKIKNCATTKIVCVSISIGLIDDIKDILSSLHIKYGLSKSKEKIDKNNVHHYESYYLYISDKNFKNNIKKTSYSHYEVCQMFDSVIESKKNKFVLIDGTIYEKKFVKSISEISLNEEVYCLNNDSHSFVCGNVVVHNCIGGIFGKGNESLKERFLQFMSEHKDRCFLEIQHHNVEKQKEYNLKMLEFHNEYGIPLIAGTDTHCLNSDHEKARKIMQLSKKITFNDDEANWDLIFRTYDELVEAYKIQGVLSEEVFLEAIENTNVMSNMIEPITFDLSFKYPKLYDNSKDKLYAMIFNENSIDSIVKEGFPKEEVLNRLKEEYDTFVAVDAVDYILLIKYIIDWAHSKDMWQGPARGSAASSLALYELGITEVNPLKYGFKFWRFMHKDKYSAADVDTDWAEKDRDRLKEWMLLEKMNLPKIQTAEIITFNTIALKGAIRDIGRGLNMPLEEVDVIAKAVKEVTEDENKYVTIDNSWREKYPELFRYVDLVQGVFTSVGSHPSGVLVTDEDISSEIGYCYIKGDDYPVSVLDMVELDSRNFVKEDLLGLDNVGIINETCKLAGIDRVSPKTINFDDDLVWSKIMEDTSLLFQINSDYGKRTVNKMFQKSVWNKIKKNIPSITRFDLLAFICALVRPCGKNVYPIVTEGNSRKTGIKEIDDLLAPEMGYPILQETQMEFVQKFCGFSFLESDKLRKCIAKKRGTREQLPLIKEGFEKNAKVKYNLTQEQSDEIINPFLQCILDATRYAFARSHDYSYTAIAYESAWLRTYYPLEYLTCCFNSYLDKPDKINEVTEYCSRNNIKIKNPLFRYSKSEYFFDKETNVIYKGVKSIKFLNEEVSNELYSLRNNTYNTFTDLLYDVLKTSINSRQLEILIKLDFFKEFGNSKELMRMVLLFRIFKNGEAKMISKDKLGTNEAIITIVAQNSTETEKKFKDLNNKSILNGLEEYVKSLKISDFTYSEKIKTQLEYMGFISLNTGKKEDRSKLVVLSEKVMYSKNGDKKPWGVFIQAQSIGSGIKNNFTIPYDKFTHNKFKQNDIINVIKYHKSLKGYWYIDKYEVLI